MLSLLIVSCFFAALTAATGSCEERHFEAQLFRYPDLAGLDSRGQRRLSAALRGQGFLSVSEAPGYAESEAAALHAAVSCLERQEQLGAEVASVRMADRTLRSTLAAEAFGSSAGGQLPAWTKKACPELQEAVSRLRKAVGLAITAVAGAADRLPGVKAGPELRSLVEAGQHLEHFHRYSLKPLLNESSLAVQSGPVAAVGNRGLDAPPTLELHTDAGLLLAMTPGLWKSGATNEDERLVHSAEPVLEVQLEDGRTMALSAPQGALLVLVGQGMPNWLPGHGFRAVPHALRLASAADAVLGGAEVRAWYGRMVFPPPHFVIGKGVSFGTWYARATAAVSGMSLAASVLQNTTGALEEGSMLEGHNDVAGCLSTTVLQQRVVDLSGSCPAGQIFCWLQCASVAHLPCGMHAQCIDRFTGKPCLTHGQGCEPECTGDPKVAHLLVSRASVARVNGEYAINTTMLSSTAGGRYSYKQVNGTGSIIWSAGRAEWTISDKSYNTGSTLYWCADDIDEPWHCTWNLAEGVEEPVPEVRNMAENPLPTTDFCTGMHTDMHMGGFVTLTDDMRKENPCLVIFSPDWVLDSYWKYVVAMIGAVLAGILCEGFLRVRSMESMRYDRARPLRTGSMKVFLYAVHRVAGYLAMLLTMTYSTELFISVVVGLSIGFAIFNLKVQTADGETACCATVRERSPPAEAAAGALPGLDAQGVSRSALLDPSSRSSGDA
mmetsp:Transcript_72446/g.172680  ORF Transcript_72446/g.172680 Transcript_72446/m.172680 type:complete len:721 (+) Transcript_72446:75-2237(+)